MRITLQLSKELVSPALLRWQTENNILDDDILPVKQTLGIQISGKQNPMDNISSQGIRTAQIRSDNLTELGLLQLRHVILYMSGKMHRNIILLNILLIIICTEHHIRTQNIHQRKRKHRLGISRFRHITEQKNDLVILPLVLNQQLCSEPPSVKHLIPVPFIPLTITQLRIYRVQLIEHEKHPQIRISPEILIYLLLNHNYFNLASTSPNLA